VICGSCRGIIETPQRILREVAREIPGIMPEGKTDALNNILSPVEVLVDVRPTLLADLTFARGRGSIVEIYNLGAASIFIAFSLSRAQAPLLSIVSGTPVLANSGRIYDNLGGLTVWGIAAALQTAGTGTRVIGGWFS